MLRLSLFCIAAFAFNLVAFTQLFNKSINQYDDNGKRKGKWITYWDDENQVPMSFAKFENGKEVGVSKEYHINGEMRLKFRYYKNRMRVKYYNEQGKLEQKGWSVMEYNEEDTHYYWHGKWKFYSEEGKLVRISFYESGNEKSQILK